MAQPFDKVTSIKARNEYKYVQQENNCEKHLANLKYKYRQEEKTIRYKHNISVLIPTPFISKFNGKRKHWAEVIKNANLFSLLANT